jgi:hypothetical protein
MTEARARLRQVRQSVPASASATCAAVERWRNCCADISLAAGVANGVVGCGVGWAEP